MRKWAIIVNSYPPQTDKSGGDYVRQVALGLARRGDEVHVWAPRGQEPFVEDPGVQLHPLPDYFGLRSLAALNFGIRRLGPCRVFLQYYPNGFGWVTFNLPFCLWLVLRERTSSPLWIMFHEVAFPWGRRVSWKINLLGAASRVAAFLAAHAAERAFISVPYWESMLAPLAPSTLAYEWMPIPSNLPTSVELAEVQVVRERVAPVPDVVVIGHFSTMRDFAAAQMIRIVPELLRKDARRRLLLTGRESRWLEQRLTESAPDLAGRIHATGPLGLDSIASYLAACDLLIQLYPDGVSARRSTCMAGLALGLPVVTTEGFLTEAIWREAGVVELVRTSEIGSLGSVVESLLQNPQRRAELGRRAAVLYREMFSVDRVVETLSAPRPATAAP